MIRLLSIVAVLFITVSCKTQKAETAKTEEGGINWVTIEEAQELTKKEPRKIIMDIYATWCGPCKRMAKYTFTDPSVVDYINKTFYAVKFNGETKDTVNYLGKQLTNNGRTHQLAIDLGLSAYPTIFYFNENFEKLVAVPGYYTPEEFLPIAKFYGEDIYKTKTINQYRDELKRQY